MRRNLAALLCLALMMSLVPEGRAAVSPPAPKPTEQSLGEVDTIKLEWPGLIETRVESATKVNILKYELRTIRPTQPLVLPLPVPVCSHCTGGEASWVGSFQAGTELVFYLVDRTVVPNQSYASTDKTHARIEQLGEGSWRIYWDDAGEGGGGPDEDFDDLITLVSYNFPGTVAGISSVHSKDATALQSDPVNSRTGNYTTEPTDLVLPGRGLEFAFTRTYNSSQITLSGVLGPGWTHRYAARLTIRGDGSVQFLTENGSVLPFLWTGSAYVSNPGVSSRLTRVTGGYQLTRRDQVVYHFDSTGLLTRMTDRNGNALTLSYTSGRLTRITDTAGRVVDLTYDASGRLSRVSGPLSRSVSYAYDTMGRLASVTDLRGGVTRYTYDASSRLATIVDANGHTVISNTYGSTGRVTAQVDARGHTTTFAWDAVNLISTMTDARGGTWVDDYTGIALSSQRDPLGNTTRYSFDANYNLVGVTDPRGFASTFTYDTRGNLITSTAPAPLSYSASVTYNGRNDPLTATDGRGNTTAFAYDPAGNLIEVTQPGGIVTTLARDAYGLVTSVMDPRGKTSSFGYDTQGNLVSLASPLGNRTTMAYDAAGRLTAVVDARGNAPDADPLAYTTSLSYDAADHITAVTDGLRNTNRYAYDPVGNRISATDALNRTTRWTYDVANNLATVTDARGGLTRYAYDEVNNLLSVRNQRGFYPERYTYDLAGRVISRMDALGALWGFSYDAAGNLTVRTDAMGASTSYAYDAIGRLTAINYPGTPDVAFGYDAAGNRVSMTDWAGTETYAYDPLNRLTSVTRGPETFAYAYDETGNVTSRTYPDGTHLAYAYDDDGRLAALNDTGATTGYAYDAAGNPISVTYPNGAAESRRYDTAGRLVGIEHSSAGVVLGDFAYALDPVGNVLEERVTRPDDLSFTLPVSYAVPNDVEVVEAADNDVVVTLPALEVTSYAYDVLDRLTETCFDEACADYVRYAYDAVGNRLSETRPPGQMTWTYDAADRVLRERGPVRHGALSVPPEREYRHDANGNVLTDGVSTYVYDQANRMIVATVGGHTGQTYRYAGDGRRLSATTWVQSPPEPDVPNPTGLPVPTASPGVGGCVDNIGDCVHDRWPDWGPLGCRPRPCPPPDFSFEDELRAYVEEAKDAARLHIDGIRVESDIEFQWDVAAPLPLLALEMEGPLRPEGDEDVRPEGEAGVLHRYTYGNQLESITGSAGTTAYYHHDRLDSPRFLTSDAVAPQAVYRYEPFGVPRYAADATAPPNPMLLNGQYVDLSTGLYHLRARQYDPSLGRFLSVDPLQRAPSYPYMSTYAYALDNPLRYTDPAGTCGADLLADGAFTAISLGTLLDHGIKGLKGAEKDLWGDAANLGLDALGLAVPCVTALGMTRRAANAANDARKLGAVLNSVDDVLTNPQLLQGMSPAEVERLIGSTPGWRIETLRRGSQAGAGWVLRQYTDAGTLTGRMIRWHPGGGHHGPNPYWTITGGEGGIVRVDG